MRARWQALHQRPPPPHLISPGMASLRCRHHRHLHLHRHRPPPPPSSYCIPASPASPHLLSHTELLLQKLSDRRSCFETFFFFFTHRPCISVSGGSTCRWWNLSSLKSWWAFPSSHGCSSHTWLPEDFPGYNFNRFLLSVILHCNKMRQTYVLLVHFFFFRDTCGCLCSKYAAQEKVNNKT